jgi:lipoprotein-anchoring transpeptidase ErfK/SrfK
MNRSTQRKLSRALVGGLGLTVALGGVFWLGKIVGSHSSSEQARAGGRGETTEAVVAAKSAANANSGAGAGADNGSVASITTPTTKPAGAGASHGDPFVLQTPTSPIASAASPTSQPQPTMLAAVATTRPAHLEVNAAPANTGANAQLAALSSGNPLADAKAQLDHGKMLDARRILNAAITEHRLDDASTKAAKKMLDDINAVVVFSTRQFKDDEFGGTFTVPSGGVLEKIAISNDVPTELLQKINGISDPRKLRAGQNLKIIRGPFNAVVDKSDFSLELWIGEPGAKGSMYVTTLPVGLGADDSTPTGVWAVQNRVANPTYFSPRGGGIIAADDPKNPLGERWIGLAGTEGAAVGKQSYGIHGTIEPDSIGKQASMGCIRLKNEDVTKVFDALVKDKSTVTVRD